MSIPLVQNNEKDSINTSIIAIKRNIERINMLLGLVDNDSPDLSGFATKQELQDAVTELQPVDEVTSGNMHSVTSNAVYNAIGQWETVWTDPNSAGNIIKGVKTPLGTFLRIRFAGSVNGYGGGNYVQNGTTLLTLPVGWRPTVYDPNRCVIGVDTTQYRCNAGLDVGTDGTIHIYFQGNTPIMNGGEYVSGLYCDLFMNIL